MNGTDWIIKQVIGALQDPFISIGVLLFSVVLIFQNLQVKDEKYIFEISQRMENAIILPEVSATLRAKLLGTSRQWFKAKLIVTEDSIVMFGGGPRMTLHTQFYSKQHLPPSQLVVSDNNFKRI